MYPTKSCFIMATPRSGSYLLCEALINTRLAGYPTERFRPQDVISAMHRGRSEFVEWLARALHAGTTPNGVFGVKLIWQFFEDFTEALRVVPEWERLPVPDLMGAIFPDPRYIRIVRRDTLRQAISFWKALQTSVWAETGEHLTSSATLSAMSNTSAMSHATSRVEPVFDFRMIDFLYRGLLTDQREMDGYFARLGIEPFTVVYEDLVLAYEETAVRILEYLEIPVSGPLDFSQRKMRRQANAQTDEWIAMYQECLREHTQRYGPRRCWPRFDVLAAFPARPPAFRPLYWAVHASEEPSIETEVAMDLTLRPA